MQTKHFSQRINLADKLYLTASTVLSTLLGLVLPFSILIIFDRVLPNQAKDTLFLLFAIILFAIYLDYLLKAQEEKISSALMSQFESNLTNKVFRSVCLAEFSKFRQREPGEYLERIATIPEIKSFFGGESVRALINLAVSIITITLIGVINTGAGLTLLLASIALAVAAVRLSDKKVANLQSKSDIEGLTTSKIIEIVSSPMDIKARNMEYRIESLMTEMIKDREKEAINYEQIESHFGLILSLTQQLSIACVVVLLASAVINLESSQGIMAAIIMLTNRYFAPYQQVMRTLSRWKLNKLHIRRIGEVLDLVTEQDNNNEQLSVEQITVVFPNRTRIQFNQGTAYLLTGISGSGKTHLSSCLSRQRIDAQLLITINDNPLEAINYNTWKNSVILVNNQSTFVEGSIIDNLTCFKPKSNTAAYALCETLGIKAQIDSLPDGFYTQLSGNQRVPFSRQVVYSLYIVRAVLADKPLVILDDIDGVYDETFVRKILATLITRTQNKITIIASNKISATAKLKKVSLSREFEHKIAQEQEG
ncbi:ATP-binding cassette domain-containing protein [Vibrio hippocampi]|uniref:Lactococcin-G-processing and transport ATP-binding protein LagD n=1 Tax=Vibrio hippocampi TaxID=654686 RepID=A0ABN8DKE0_9VIBR|nr:ATP-binding cassette domain-containing protein [Vibrio hippocampi]CAH0525767.1 Lactococcin-G-processing and transport ATP-binding protein LagD [Vibrio hippocampi]